MSRRGPSRVAYRTRGRGARHALRPCRLYPAARLGAPGPPESTPPLWLTLSHGRPDAPGHRRGPEASRGGHRRLRRAAYLGPTTPPSPASPLCPPRRGPGARRHPVAPVSAALLPARPRPLTPLSAPVPGGARAALWPGPARLDGSLSGTHCASTLAAAACQPARHGVGGSTPKSLCRTHDTSSSTWPAIPIASPSRTIGSWP